jgi:hypothetical protein
MTNNKRQVATLSKLYTLTITTHLLLLLHVHIPTRIGLVRGEFVDPWRTHRRRMPWVVLLASLVGAGVASVVSLVVVG